MFNVRTSLALAFAAFGMLLSSAARATNHDEGIAGDLSGDRLNPTPLVLSNGANRITATSMSGDLEYFRLTVPAGLRLSAINVVSNTSPGVSFIAVQGGSTFTEPPTGTNTANLLGYTHFGAGNGTVGTDILGNMGTAPGAIRFTPPLPAGNYTFWSQETGGAVTYTLDFLVTAAPAAAPLPRAAVAVLALALAFVGLSRVRRQAR